MASKSNSSQKGNTLEKTDKFEILENILREKQGRAIVWCVYLNTVGILNTLLTNAGYKCYSYTGEMTGTAQDQAIKNFLGEDQSVLIATIQSAGKGNNFQCCNLAIFYEYSMVPSVNEQAEKRCHRIGQNDTVNIYYLYGKDTIEEVQINMLRAKQNLSDIVIHNKAFTRDTINSLIKRSRLEF